MSDLVIVPSTYDETDTPDLITVSDTPARVTGTNVTYPDLHIVEKDYGADYFTGVSVDEVPSASNGVRFELVVTGGTDNGFIACSTFCNLHASGFYVILVGTNKPHVTIGIGKSGGSPIIRPYYMDTLGATVPLATFTPTLGTSYYGSKTFGNGKFSVGLWTTDDLSGIPVYLETATDVGATSFQYHYLMQGLDLTGNVNTASGYIQDVTITGYGESALNLPISAPISGPISAPIASPL